MRKMNWNVISFIMAVILAVLCGVMTYYNTFETVDNMVIDSAVRRFDSDEVDVPIRIIAIDDKTIDVFGKFDTWSREVTADLIDILNAEEEKPIIIGLDLLYTEEKDAKGDKALVEACQEAGNVCLALGQFKAQGAYGVIPSGQQYLQQKQELVYPFEALCEVVQLGIGNNTVTGRGDTVREFLVHMQNGETTLESFAVVLYQAYQEHAGRESQVTAWNNNQLRFNYSRSASEYETYSFWDVLSGKVDVAEFANTIVIVGDYTTDAKHMVPQVQGSEMPDAALQANLVEAMLSQKVVLRFSNVVLAMFYCIFIFSCYYIVFLMQKKRGLLLTLFILLVHAQIVFMLRDQYYIPVVPLWLFTALAMLGGLIIVYIKEKQNKEQLLRALETYVEPQVVEQILENRTFDIKLGGERKDIAVLFVDIRGFTSLSEMLLPEQIVAILNEYLELIAHAVARNEGTLDKFIGDAAMAVFNAPEDQEEYEKKALYTAADILEGASKLNEHCLEKYGKEVAFGIGIHCGTAIVGNIGCECRMDYTAIGDTVNTSSRLEAKAKPGQILISRDLYQRVKEFVVAESIGELALKGKSRVIEAYEVKQIIGRG